MNLEENLEESSRAAPADEIVSQSYELTARTFENTSDILQQVQEGNKPYKACFICGEEETVGGFQRKLSVGATIICEILMQPSASESNEGDELGKPQIVAQAYLCENVIIFLFRNMPSFLYPKALDLLSNYLTPIGTAYVFVYESIAEFRCPRGEYSSDFTFIVPNTYYKENSYRDVRLGPLPMPNVVGKAGAAVLTYYERNGVPAVATIHYSELTDALSSLVPFTEMIQGSPDLTSMTAKCHNLLKHSSNLHTVLNSNLFV